MSKLSRIGGALASVALASILVMGGGLALPGFATVALADSTTDCAGGDNCNHQAAITNGETTTHYETLTEALSVASGSQTITLLKDIDNSVTTEDYSKGINYSLKAGTTLDGNGHTLRGHIGVHIPAAGATVKNVKFVDIHNSTEVDEATCKYYGWESKTGNQSAIYASGLTGTATITGCTFDNIDWDAIQITPTKGASIVITDNVFQHTNDTDTQLRYVHIQYTAGYGNVVLKQLIVTDNEFYVTENPKDSFCSVGVWDVSKNADDLNLKGNYLQDPSSTEVTVIGTEYMFPSRSQATVDTDDYQPVAYDGSVVFDNLQRAVDQTTKYVKMMVNTDQAATIPADKEIYFYSYGHDVGTITNNGSMQIYGSDLASGSQIVNNGTMSLSGSSATVYEIVNNGTIKITSGATYDLGKISGSGTVTITGGTFSTKPSEAQLAQWYKVVEQSGEPVTYKVSSMTMAEKVEAGLVATSSSSSGNCYTSVTEGVNATDKARTYLQTDSDENVVISTPYSGGRSLYANRHSFTGSIVIQENCDFLNLLGSDFNLKYVSGDRLRIGFYSTAAEVTIQNADLDLLEVSASGDCTVTGGNYGSVIAHTYYDKKTDAQPKYSAELSITGGCFASDTVTRQYTDVRPVGVPASEEVPLSTFLPEGYTIVESTGAYPYQVVPVSDTAAEVVPAAPSVSAPEGNEVATELANTLRDTTNLVAGSGLDVAASTVANNNVISSDDGKSELEEANVTVGESDQVTIVIQPYMDVTIMEASTENKTLKLDINPKYNVVATTAKLDGDNPDKIVIAAEGVKDANAAIVKAAMPLTITKPVTVTIPLPGGFAGVAETLYIEHEKSASRTYFYTGTVNENELTFTNPNGFSQFTISATNGAQAELNGIGYDTLANALADAGDGDTVTVLQDNLTATMSGASRTVTLKNGTVADTTVTINGQQLTIGNGEAKEFAYTAPSGGGSVATTYSVTVAEAENGEVSVDKTSATAGERVTVTATPDEDYEVSSVAVTHGDEGVDVTDNADGTYAFVMPAGDVTVTVTFEASAPAVELPFTDVAEGDWYYGPVAFVYARGLMTGYEGTTLFGPEDALGREQAAAVLFRALGAGAQAPACGLADVSQGDWYAQAVNWAVASGLLTGYGDGSGLFGVGDALTRDQFAAIVARVAKADLTQADPSALEAFSDGGEVAEWAVPAVSWAVEAGVLKGSDDGSGGMELRASAEITRGEMATMIMRAAEAGLLPAA